MKKKEKPTENPTENPLPQLSLREISILQGLTKLNISNQVTQVHICFVVNLIIFNFYAECIMRTAGLEEAQAEVKPPDESEREE